MDLARRQTMGLIGAAAMAAAMPAATAAKGGLDLTGPAQRLRAYMLMRGALDDRLVIGCVQGQYFGVVGDEPTPLFGLAAATFARYRPRPDGGYDSVTAERAYFIDMVTGALLDEWRNPYTGEMVTVPITASKPSRLSILPDLSLKLGREILGMRFDHDIQPAQVRGDDVWIPELSITSASVPGMTKPFHYSEKTTMHARLSELTRPGIKRVRCETSFTNVVGWRPWMKMGDRPGHMMAIGAGTYGASLDTLPQAWIALTRATMPSLLADPASALEPLWSKG